MMLDRAFPELDNVSGRAVAKPLPPVPIGHVHSSAPPLSESHCGPSFKPPPPVPKAPSLKSAPAARRHPADLLTRSEFIYKDTSVPAGPPRPPPPLMSKATSVDEQSDA